MLVAVPARAQQPMQPPPLRLAVRDFTADDGLGGATITSLARDSHGFLWVGTPDELLICDGEQFLPFRYRDKSGTPQPFRRAIVMPCDGGFMIVHENGVHQYWEGLGRLNVVHLPFAFPDIPLGASLAADPQYPGWYRFFSTQVEGWYHPRSGRWLPARPKSNEVPVLCIDRNEKLTLLRPEKANTKYWRLWEPVTGRLSAVRQFPIDAAAILLLPQGTLFIDARDSRSLWLMDSLGRCRLLARLRQPGPALSAGVYQRHIYIAAGRQLFLFDPAHGSLREVLDQAGTPPVKTGFIAHFLSAGNALWIGTNASGLLCLSPQGSPFFNIRSDTPAHNLIHAILPDLAHNRIYTGAYFGAFIGYDTEGNFIENLTPHLTAPATSWSAYFNHIQRLDDETVLIFGGQAQACLFYPKTKRVLHLDRQMTQEFLKQGMAIDKLPGRKTVRAIDSNEWWMTGLHGLERWRLDRSQGGVRLQLVRRIVLPCEAPEGISYYQNSWWCAGEGMLYRIGEGSIADSFALPLHALVSALRPDPEGRLWIATESGLMIWRAGKVLKVLSTETGLPNNHVYALMTDSLGWMWGSTNGGLFALRRSDLRCRVFSIRDGLQGDEFNAGAVARDELGRFYFGGVNGVSIFYPARALHGEPAAGATFIRIATPDSCYYTYPQGVLPSIVRLGHDRASLRLSFRAAQTGLTGRSHYEYRIEANRAWTDIGRNEELQLSLAPGSYTIQVRLHGQLSSPAMLRVEVIPPYYRRPWFIVLAGLLCCTGIAATVILRSRARYRRKMSALEAEQRIQHEKERISRELHDELGARAAVMVHNAAQLEAAADNELAAPIAARLREDAADMLTALRETVWTLKQQHITLESLWYRFKNFIAKLAASYDHVHFSISQSEHLPELPLESDRALNLLRILQEAIINALKHSGASEISVSLEWRDGESIFTLRDNGRGFDEEATRGDDRGNGLHNMYYRAKESELALRIRSGAGTGVMVELRMS